MMAPHRVNVSSHVVSTSYPHLPYKMCMLLFGNSLIFILFDICVIFLEDGLSTYSKKVLFLIGVNFR